MGKARLGPAFWKFRGAQALSIVGDQIGLLSLSWYMLDRSGTTAALTAVLSWSLLFLVGTSLLLGPITDSRRKRNVLIAGDIANVISWAWIGALIAAGAQEIAIFLPGLALSALGTSLSGSGRRAMLKLIVSPELFQKAQQRSQAVFSSAGIVGPLVGGVIVTATGPFMGTVANVTSFAVSVFLLSRIRTNEERPQGTLTLREYLASTFDGFSRTLRNPALATVGLLLVVIAMLNAPIQALVASWVRHTMLMEPYHVGLMDGAFSVGMIATSFAVGAVMSRISLSRATVLRLSWLGLGVSLLVIGNAPFYAIGVLGIMLHGCSMAFAQTIVGERVGLLIPFSHVARISMVFSATQSLGSALSTRVAGLVADGSGPSIALSLFGIGFIVVSMLFGVSRVLVDITEKEPAELEGYVRFSGKHGSSRVRTHESESARSDD